MVVITNSTDITLLKIKFVFDFSLATPVLKAVNQSEGPHLHLCKIGFAVTSPSGNKFYNNGVDPTAWTVLGDFTEFVFPLLPTFQGITEYSGNPYTMEATAADSAGKLFNDVVSKNIIAPNGNANSSKHYGGCIADVQIDCNKGLAFVRDITNYTYQGLAGTFITKKITVISPPDADMNTPAPVEYTGTSMVQHSLASSGKGYKAVVVTVVEYILAESVTFRVKYISSVAFDVNCNYDLCPLICDLENFISNYDDCDGDKQKKLVAMNSKLLMAVTGIVKPTCGVDVAKLIGEIKEIGGFRCDCSANNQYGFNGAISGGAINYQFSTCGDVTASADVVGSNVTFTIRDTKYEFIAHESSGQSFTFPTAVNGCTKTVYLKIDRAVFAQELLTIIKNNGDLANLFNSIVVGNGFKLTVNGKCIVATNPLSDYTLTLNQFPSSSDQLAIFKSITIDNQVNNLSYAVNAANISGLQTKLNSLNLGSYVVSYNNNVLTITSTGNSHIINSAVISNAGTADDRFMTLNKVSQSLPAQDANLIIQAIIDYLCGINTDKVYLGHDLVINKPIKLADGTFDKYAFNPKSTLWDVLSALGEDVGSIITQLFQLKPLDCAGILSKFSGQPTLKLSDADFIIGSKSDKCAALTAKEIYQYVWSSIVNSPDFCVAVKKCAAGTTCIEIQGFIVDKENLSTQTMWVADQIICEQDGQLFSLLQEVTGFSSPSALFYDETSQRMYVIDIDNVNGNVYYFDPNNFANTGSVTYVTGIADVMYSYIVDRAKRRILMAGLNTNGLVVYDIATGTKSYVTYGSNTPFSRLSITILDNIVICYDHDLNTLTLLNRDSYALLSTTNISTIPSGNTYIADAYQLIQVGEEIWVAANQRYASSIARYNLTMTSLIGTIPLPDAVAVAAGWGFGKFWQTHYYDKDKNKWYVFDTGANQMYVIDTISHTIVNTQTFTNRQGKSNITAEVILDPITTEHFISFALMNSPADGSQIKRIYKLNRDTYQVELVYIGQYFETLELQVGTSYVWGFDRGLVKWQGGSWDTDGAIKKYTH